MPLIGMGKLAEFSRNLLAKGAPAAVARRVADVVVRTEAFSVATHGLAFLSYACGAIASVVDPTATPFIVRRKGAGTPLDARRCSSQLSMDLAAELAFRTGGDPVIADFSRAAVATGKVNRMIKQGERAPERISRDRDGRLTNDPAVVPQSGSILGGEHYGHKGYGLSLWCEALVAVAGGSCRTSPRCQPRRTSLCPYDRSGRLRGPRRVPRGDPAVRAARESKPPAAGHSRDPAAGRADRRRD